VSARDERTLLNVDAAAAKIAIANRHDVARRWRTLAPIATLLAARNWTPATRR
jgi:hypothetical protein